MIIELDSVELYFNERRILNDAYLKAETGKTTGLLGRNGCRESCLLQILFGSLLPKYKFIKIDGKPLTKPLCSHKHPLSAPTSSGHGQFKSQNSLSTFEVGLEDFISHFENFSPHYNTKLNRISGGERRVIETYTVLKCCFIG